LSIGWCYTSNTKSLCLLTTNYRPVSNLTLVSKVTERVVASLLNEYLVANDLLPRYQSAYWKRHSTETAILRAWSDILTAAGRCQVTLLGLLDLSAAFDCVDHDILLQRLQIGLRMSDNVLGWIQSFLTNRMQQVSFNGQLSRSQSLLFGVPQGSVLVPLLYLLYTAELEQLILHHGLRIDQYADDSQVYISAPVSNVQAAVHIFVVCIHDINIWMRASRLQLNPTKTQVMWLGSDQQLKHVDISDISVLSTTVPVVEIARDLGAIIDSRLTLCACRVVLSGWVLSTPATTPTRTIDDGGSCNNRSCGVCILSVSLL